VIQKIVSKAIANKLKKFLPSIISNENLDGAQDKVARRGAWAALCRNEVGLYQESSTIILNGINEMATERIDLND
jgi:hypothetical protein